MGALAPTPISSSTTTSVGGSAGGSPDAIAGILKAMGSVLATQANVTANANKLSYDLSNFAAGINDDTRRTNLDAGDAAANTAKAEAEAKLKLQAESAEVSANYTAHIQQSAKDFNLHMDSVAANIQSAQDKTKESIGDVLSGDLGFGKYLHDKIVSPASKDIELATSEQALAAVAKAKLAFATEEYNGLNAANKSGARVLGVTAAADAATLAATPHIIAANKATLEGVALQAANIQSVMTESNHAVAVALQIASTKISGLNAERSWSSMMSRTAAPEDELATAKLGAAALGNTAEASGFTLSILKQMNSTPAGKAQLAAYLDAGMKSILQQATNPNGAIPNILGSAGEYITFKADTNSPALQGSEGVQKKLMEFYADSVDATGKALKPVDRAANVDRRVKGYLEAHRNDIDSDPTFGQVSLAAMYTVNRGKPMTSLIDPERPQIGRFKSKVLDVIATTGKPVPFDVIVQAAEASGLPDQVINEGLANLGASMKAFAASTRRYATIGIPEHKYTAALNNGSVLYGKTTSVDVTSAKDIADFRFNKTMRTKQKMQVVTPFDYLLISGGGDLK